MCLLAVLALATGLPSADAAPPAFRVTPEAVVLDGPEATLQLLVRGRDSDLTHRVRYDVADPNVLSVSGRGLLEP
ncbi:MAG TPA: hypothetical protein VM597_21520, partial [Gemmataceae bacterium]|nr:hypothetical protein [Gemmataceae bacterium]